VDQRCTLVHGGSEQRGRRGRSGAWPERGAPCVGACRQGGRGRAGHGEAKGRLTNAGPVEEGQRDGAGDHDGSGFAETAAQVLGRRGK
jgi:hypothetical protein